MTTRIRSLLPLMTLTLALGSTAACKSEIDNKPAAKVEEAGKKADDKDAKKADAATPDAAKPAVVDLVLAKDKSKIGFLGAKQVGEHPGSFSDFSGTAKVSDGKLQALDIVVKMDSLEADVPDLTAHLKNADFFDVPQFPEAKFSLLEVSEKAGENGATHEVAGNLEMKGQAKKVTFPATITISETEVKGKAEFKIDRTLWGITYAGMADNLIKNEVALTLDLVLTRA